eukprot:gene3750-4008_t
MQLDSLQLQEAIYAAAFDELCRQVSVGCCDRGLLMAQLWGALRSMLFTVLDNCQAVQGAEAAAHAATAAMQAKYQKLQQQHEDEHVELRAINQRHAAKAEEAKQETEQYRHKHDQVCSQGAMVTSAASTKDLGLLADMLTEEEGLVVERALVEGVTPEQVHQLLLGITPEGDDIRPWVAMAGACCSVLRSATDPGHLRRKLLELIRSCDAASLSSYLQPPSALQVLSQAVHLGSSPSMLMQVLDGSLGLPGQPNQIKQQQNQALAEGPGPGAGAKTVVQAAVSGGGLAGSGSKSKELAGRPTGTSVRLQLVSIEQQAEERQKLLCAVGAGLPYLPVVGILATKYGRDRSELGGPVTEALSQAAMSTKSKVLDLESRTKSMHRDIVLLKRTLAEQRKHEQERIDQALRDEKRKIARRDARPPSLLERFLQTKWGDYFMGIGVVEEIPAVMRASVPIVNRHMPKREAEKLVNEIWQLKAEQEAAAGVQMHLSDATAAFLERRFFSISRLVTEMAYNFIYSLGQHSYDADCNLFLRIFTGDVEEAVRHEQQALEGEILKMLTLLDVSVNRQATGWLHKSDVKTALAGFFKNKKVDRLAELFEALDTDEGGEAVNYKRLFLEHDDDYNQGMTAETIRSQHLSERLEYLQEMQDVIHDAAEDHQSTSLSSSALLSCLAKAHNGTDAQETLETFVARAFGSDWKQHQHRTLPIGTIIRAIRRGNLQPVLRPTAASAAGAISKIAAVGKFQKKLLSALTVRMTDPSLNALSKRQGTVAFAADGSSQERTPGTKAQCNPSNAGGSAAERGGAGSGSINGGKVAKSRRATVDAVNAAVEAVRSSNGGERKGRQASSQVSPIDSGGDTLEMTSTADSGTVVSLPRAMSGMHCLATAAASSRLDINAAALPSCLTQQPLAAGRILEQSRLPAALPRKSTANSSPSMLSVGVLSALEAVRQTWLKEEEVKMFGGSRSPSEPGSSTRPSLGLMSSSSRYSAAGQHSNLQSFGENTPGKLMGQAGAAAAAGGGRRGETASAWKAGTSSCSPSGSLSGTPTTCTRHTLHPADVGELLLSSGGYVLPLVPALRLGETSSEVHTPRSGAGTARSLGSRSARGLGTAAGNSRDNTGSMRVRVVEHAKPVPSSSARGFFLPPMEPEPRDTTMSNANSPAGKATAIQWAVIPSVPAVTCDTSSRDKDAPAAAKKASNSGSLLLADAHDADEAETAPAASPPSKGRSNALAAAAPGESIPRDSLSMHTDTLARRQSLKSKAGPAVVPPPPLLLLTDADDVADDLCGGDAAVSSAPESIKLCSNSSGQSSPMSCSSGGMLCRSPPFSTKSAGAVPATGGVTACDPRAGAGATPTAPAEQEGKMTALMMRQLNKKKSLMRLEEVMLMVASQAEAAVQLTAATDH